MSLARILALTTLLAVVQLAPAACRAQRPASSLTPAAAANDSADELVAVAFRALIDEIVGDSAEQLCLSVTGTDSTGTRSNDVDPRPGVLERFRGFGTAVRPYSACAADERNFGPTRGLLRLRDLSPAGNGMLTVHADAVGDHTARYECIVPLGGRAHCRIVGRD